MPFALLALQSPVMPIDLVQLVAVFMGISVVLIPVIGITARFALKPTVEALSRLFEKRGMDESVSILERRMALMEQHVESIETNVRRLVDVSEFDHQLTSGSKDAGPSQATEARSSE